MSRIIIKKGKSQTFTPNTTLVKHQRESLTDGKIYAEACSYVASTGYPTKGQPRHRGCDLSLFLLKVTMYIQKEYSWLWWYYCASFINSSSTDMAMGYREWISQNPLSDQNFPFLRNMIISITVGQLKRKVFHMLL